MISGCEKPFLLILTFFSFSVALDKQTIQANKQTKWYFIPEALEATASSLDKPWLVLISIKVTELQLLESESKAQSWRKWVSLSTQSSNPTPPSPPAPPAWIISFLFHSSAKKLFSPGQEAAGARPSRPPLTRDSPSEWPSQNEEIQILRLRCLIYKILRRDAIFSLAKTYRYLVHLWSFQSSYGSPGGGGGGGGKILLQHM